GDGQSDLLALVILLHAEMIDPAVAMPRHLVSALGEGARHERVAFERPTTGEDRRLDAVLVEQVEHAPRPDARAVFEGRFDPEVACFRIHRWIDELTDPLALCVTVADAEFRALLVVQDQGNHDARIVRPANLGILPAIANEIAHAASSS